MAKRRTKGDGGLIQRHDHTTCPPAIQVGVDDRGKPIMDRAKHACQGRWVGTVDAPDPATGRKRRKYIYGRTQKEVARKLKDAVRDRDRGTLVLTTTTVSAWMAEWLARQERTLKPQTMRSYREKSRNYIEPTLGHHRLTSLRAGHIEGMYTTMRADGRAEATVRQTHAILRAALKDAVRKDQLAISPMEKVDAPGTEKNVREQFNVDQARTVLRAAGDDARWWLALFYGMRQGEVLGLEWEWVDFDRHALKIERTLQTGADGRLFLGPPKTKKSQRWLPMIAQVEVRLRLRWELAGRPSTGLVFHLDGNPIQPKRDWQGWRELIDRATVPPLAPLPYIALHAARNSAASLLEAARVPDRLAMQILGQSQVQTTHGYQTADLERMGQAFEAVGSLLAIE